MFSGLSLCTDESTAVPQTEAVVDRMCMGHVRIWISQGVRVIAHRADGSDHTRDPPGGLVSSGAAMALAGCSGGNWQAYTQPWTAQEATTVWAD